MSARSATLFVAGVAVAFAVALSLPLSARQPGAATHASISYADAEPLLALLRPFLPPDLRDKPPATLQSEWAGWVAARDAEIRGRVARGDDDSLVNLWLFGTSFTTLPPARGGHAAAADARLDDFLEALAAPATVGRLDAARQLLADRGIDVATGAGRDRARLLLRAVHARMLAEAAEHTRRLEQAMKSEGFQQSRAYASLYETRGLSTDTSLLSSFGIESALRALSEEGAWPRRIRRVAVVGPGLDVINKADGHDFYPEQTIQPFALIDSLIRLRLSDAADLSVTTFDISARVNRHLGRAREQAARGAPYLLHLPLGTAEQWSDSVQRYWTQLGTSVGVDAAPAARVDSARVRAIGVRPSVVASITPRDLNVVVERLTLADAELFDLVVATNVFAYYGTFEQGLAVANIGRMLRPGGSLLANQAVLPVPPLVPDVGQHHVVYSNRQFDTVFWYQRASPNHKAR